MSGGGGEKESAMNREQKAAIAKVIKKYGSKIDLETNPEVLIEVLAPSAGCLMMTATAERSREALVRTPAWSKAAA
jgi:hypothetical protein